MINLNTEEFYSEIFKYLKKNEYSTHYIRAIKSVSIENEDNEYGNIGENYVILFECYNGYGMIIEKTMLIPVIKFNRDTEKPFIILDKK